MTPAGNSSSRLSAISTSTAALSWSQAENPNRANERVAKQVARLKRCVGFNEQLRRNHELCQFPPLLRLKNVAGQAGGQAGGNIIAEFSNVTE